MLRKDPTKSNAIPRAQGLVGQTVLLVDDEVDILQSLRTLFEREFPGMRILTATTAAEGLDLLAREPVDLIVSDYKMPGMSGLDFLARANAVEPGIARILVTAYPDLEIAVRAIKEAGIESFFVKPFDLEQVLDAVAAVLYERLGRRLRSRWMARAAESATTRP